MANIKKMPQEPADYCTTAELANLFGCSSHWIGDLTKSGVLRKHETEAGARYNVVEATRAYVKYLREKAARRSDKDDSTAQKEEEKLAAEVRIKNAKADYAELELQEFQRQMHRSEDVEKMTMQLVFTIRGLLIALPGRLAVDVTNVSTAAEASVVIRKEINAVLDELSRFKYDPAEYERLAQEYRANTGACR